MENRPIFTLPHPTSAQIRSAVAIPSFAQIVNELAQNSLDAGATRINCSMELSEGYQSIRMEDDGYGIAPDQLARIGEPHASSKGRNAEAVAPLGNYGYRGEALSSVAALGLLEITSRSTSSGEARTKIIKHGQTIYTGSPRQAGSFRQHGTTVLVRDLFAKIPVRQANLAASSAGTLAASRKVIETLALVHPAVKWSLTEERAVGTSIDGGSRRIVAVGGVAAPSDVFRSLYGSSTLGEIQKIRVSKGSSRIDGFISLQGALNKAHQYLYINRMPLDKGELHHAIAKRFTASQFSVLSGGIAEEDHGRGIRRSPRRLERYPIYVLDITLPSDEVDMTYDPKKGIMSYKDIEAVTALLLAVVDQVLDRHGFSVSRQADEVPDSPTRGSRTPAARDGHLNVHFVRTRLESSIPDRTITRKRSAPTRGLMGEPMTLPSPRSGVIRQAKKLVDDAEDEIQVGVLATPHAEQQDTAAVLSHVHQSESGRIANAVEEDIAFDRNAVLRARVIRQIDNKFICCSIASPRDPQSTLGTTLVLVDQHAADERISIERILQELCRGFQADSMEVAQLPEPRPLVLLTGEETRTLATPEVIDVFRRWGLHIELLASTSTGDSQHEYAQVRVHAVPAILQARLGRPEATEMTRLLKLHLKDVAALLPAIRQYLSGTASEARSDWTRVLGWMPREMLELANSKACRNAIMFGDKLDQDQCLRLIRQLAGARNPFICAHGRPSLIPIGIIQKPHHPRQTISADAWRLYKDRITRLAEPA